MKNFSNKSDSELVSIYLQSKNQKAFKEIYFRYVNDVFRFIYSRVGNKEWSGDILSDTYSTLLDILEKYDHQTKLKSFIIGISLNKIRKFWSTNTKLQSEDFNEDYIIVDEYDEDHERSILKLSYELKGILVLLPEKDLQVLVNRFLNGKSFKETALLMDLSEVNVRVIQNRAIKKAQKLLLNQVQTN